MAEPPNRSLSITVESKQVPVFEASGCAHTQARKRSAEQSGNGGPDAACIIDRFVFPFFRRDHFEYIVIH